MRGDGYRNVMLTVMAVAVVVCGYVFVSAVSRLRLRVETVAERLSVIDGKLEAIDGRLVQTSLGVVRPPETTKAEDTATSSDFANAEFYDPDAQPGGGIITAIGNETKNMNYLVNNEALVGTLWDYCYDSLAARNYARPEEFQPQLAASWSLSEDKMTYSIKLREGALWHDFDDPVTGKSWRNVEVTAEDFKFYVDVVKNPDTDCAPIRTYLKDLDRIEVVSDREFKVHWTKRYFLSESITLGLMPLPRHLYHAYDGPFDGKRFNDDHERNRLIVGCGPYRFDRWEKDRKIILTRFDAYYGARYGAAPALARVELEVIKHPNTRFQALLAKDVDRVGLLPDQWVNKTNVPAFDPDQGFLRKYHYLSRSYTYIGYNLQKSIFKDRLTRTALTHLVDRKRILKDVFHNLGQITTGPFFINSPYYDKSVEPYPFSIERARELLADAGWRDADGDGVLERDGEAFEFTILQPSSSTLLAKMLPIIKEDMAKAGVRMRINKVEWSVYVQRLEKKSFDVCVLAWSMGFESDPYQIWHSSQADKLSSSNHICFKNAEADRLIEEIRGCFDLERRVELCHEFHRLLHKEQPYTFLICSDSLVAQSDKFRNVRLFSDGLVTKIMWVPPGARRSPGR